MLGKKNNGIYLIKGSGFETTNGGKEAYAEFYMTQIAKELGIECISYDLEKFQGEIVSSCPIATSENYGYKPIGNILKKYNIKFGILDGSIILELKNIYKENFNYFEDMMLFDVIIGNIDRHLGNFGMVKDNNTGEYVKPFPIFDNGLCMLNIMTKIEINNIEYLSQFNKEKTNSFNQTFEEAMKVFSNSRHIPNLIKLTNFKIKKHSKYNLNDEWLNGLENNIRSNAKICLEFIKEKNKKSKDS